MTTSAPSSSASCSPLRLPAGLRFGYREAPWKGGRTQEVLRLDEELRLEPGLHLLIAANGAGKTTLMRTLAGLQPILQGSLGNAPEAVFFADDLAFADELSARMIFQSLLPKAWQSEALALSAQWRLDTDKIYSQLSRGNRQKIPLILAETRQRLSQGCLLLQDESLAGLDAWTRREVCRVWGSAEARHIRLIALHETDALQGADSVLSLREGRLVQHHPADAAALKQLCETLIE